jgi:hypothetical protein
METIIFAGEYSRVKPELGDKVRAGFRVIYVCTVDAVLHIQ